LRVRYVRLDLWHRVLPGATFVPGPVFPIPSRVIIGTFLLVR
jgi:hypothetical protein